MSAVKPVLSVRDLSIALPPGADRANAVTDISFDVPAGKIVCLLGESGSGKSVIANAVMGLMPSGLKVVKGSIDLQGEALLTAGESRLRALRGASMAMVFQEPMTALNPVMTCGDQVDEMLAQHSKLSNAERRKKILAIFARVHLPEPERIYASYPHQLSGGQRQRAVIATALIARPAVLLADEPTTALDVTTQAEVLALFRRLVDERGASLLFVTHDLAVLAQVAEEAAVLSRGRVVESGSVARLLDSPAHPVTRGLVEATRATTWRAP